MRQSKTILRHGSASTCKRRVDAIIQICCFIDVQRKFLNPPRNLPWTRPEFALKPSQTGRLAETLLHFDRKKWIFDISRTNTFGLLGVLQFSGTFEWKNLSDSWQLARQHAGNTCPLRYRHQNLGELITNPSPNYVKTHFCWFSESNMKTTPTRPLACRCSANRCRQRSRLQAQLSQKSDHNESLVRLQEETARIHTKYQNRSIRNILYLISYNYITYIIYIVMYIHINYKCHIQFYSPTTLFVDA